VRLTLWLDPFCDAMEGNNNQLSPIFRNFAFVHVAGEHNGFGLRFGLRDFGLFIARVLSFFAEPLR
jgi:hypothetical protein